MKLLRVPGIFASKLLIGGAAVSLLACGLCVEALGHDQQDAPKSEGGVKISTSRANRAYLGVFAESIDETEARELGLSDAKGVHLRSVVRGGPAEKAGLQKGDVILEIDGEGIVNHEHFTTKLRKAEAGKALALEIWRDKKKQKISVTPEKWGESRSFSYSDDGKWRAEVERNVRDAMRQSRTAVRETQEAMKAYGKAMARAHADGVYALAGMEAFRGRLGVRTQELSDQLASFFGAKDGGILVTQVESGSSAEKAGLKAGDCITSVNGNPVKRSWDLSKELSKIEEGNATLGVVRDKQSMTLTATLEKRTDRVNWRIAPRRGRLGVNIDTLTDQLAKSLGADKGGVLVTSVSSGSAAEKAGLKAGDCITAVNGNAVKDADDLVRELRKAESGAVALQIVRDRRSMTVNATLDKVETGELFFVGDNDLAFIGPDLEKLELERLNQVEFEFPNLKELEILPLKALPKIELDRLRELELLDFSNLH